MPRSWVAPPAALASMSARLPTAVLRNGRACQRTRLSAFLTRCSRSKAASPALMIVFRLARNVHYCHRSCLPPAVGVSAPCVIGPPDKAAPVVRPDDSRWKRRQPVPPRAAAASAGRPFGSHRQRAPPPLVEAVCRKAASSHALYGPLLDRLDVARRLQPERVAQPSKMATRERRWRSELPA